MFSLSVLSLYHLAWPKQETFRFAVEKERGGPEMLLKHMSHSKLDPFAALFGSHQTLILFVTAKNVILINRSCSIIIYLWNKESSTVGFWTFYKLGSDCKEAALRHSCSTVWFTCLLILIYTSEFAGTDTELENWELRKPNILDLTRLFGTKSDPARPTWVLGFWFNLWTKDCCLIFIDILLFN